MTMISIEEAIDYMDTLPDTWKEYRVGCTERREQNGWVIEPFSMPRVNPERMFLLSEGGLDRDPGWGDGFTALRHNGKIWMSDTRAEIMEHSPLINKLWWCESIPGQTVLINGLGIGMAVQACLRHGVEHVDVVEIEQDVIDLVGPLFDPAKVTIHKADAYEIEWPRGKSWTFAWHDIWPSISPENLAGMRRLHKRYKTRVQWQDSWQYKGCLRAQREKKKFKAAMESGDWSEVKRLDPLF